MAAADVFTDSVGSLALWDAGDEWSFADCVSFVILHELRLREAFTSDRHFRQAGLVPLLKT